MGAMWFYFGLGALAVTALNLAVYAGGRAKPVLSAVALALTCFALCSFYSDAAERLMLGDYAGLADTVPTLHRVLWIVSSVSVTLNLVTFIPGKMRGKKDEEQPADAE